MKVKSRRAKRLTVKAAVQPEMKEMTWAVTLPDGSRWEIVLRRLSGMHSLTSIWRKIQDGIITAFKFAVKEWGVIKLRKFKVDWKAREITFAARRKR